MLVLYSDSIKSPDPETDAFKFFASTVSPILPEPERSQIKLSVVILFFELISPDPDSETSFTLSNGTVILQYLS